MLPSVKTLREVFGDNASEARRVLEMTRAELVANYPAAQARVDECYHPPTTADVRLHILNEIAGTFGVEAFETRREGWCDYLNAGDSYAPTLVRFRGRYRVTTCGDIAERYA